jgi:hypothetical protein
MIDKENALELRIVQVVRAQIDSVNNTAACFVLVVVVVVKQIFLNRIDRRETALLVRSNQIRVYAYFARVYSEQLVQITRLLEKSFLDQKVFTFYVILLLLLLLQVIE